MSENAAQRANRLAAFLDKPPMPPELPDPFTRETRYFSWGVIPGIGPVLICKSCVVLVPAGSWADQHELRTHSG